MQHPKTKRTDSEATRKCECGHARRDHGDGRGICERLNCECEAFKRPAARVTGPRGDAGDDAAAAPVTTPFAVVVERMAGWYERDRSTLLGGWKRCTVHGTAFATFCAGCAAEVGMTVALAA